MIEGVQKKKLSPILDDRGYLMEILRADDPQFTLFGQCYITTCFPGVIKAWHMHRYQEDNITAISGNIKLVLADLREHSGSCGELEEFFLGVHNPMLVRIPKGVYHGFTTLGNEMAVILNITDRAYDHDNPDEVRMEFNSDKIPYKWTVKNR